MHAQSVERIHRVIAALSHRATAEEVAGALVRAVAGELGACAARVGLFDEGDRFHALASFGFPEELVEYWSARHSSDSLIMRDVLRGESIFTRRGSEDPRVDSQMVKAFGDSASCVVPLTAAGATIGYLTIAFDHAREFDLEERDFILTLAAHCGHSIERARLFEAERTARAAADSARRRLETLLAQLPVSVMIVDRDGHATLNDQLRSLYGTTRRAGNINDYPPGDPRHARHLDGRIMTTEELPILRAFKGDETRGLLVLIQRGDGEMRTISVNAGPVRSESGEITAAVAAFTDITERQRLLEELREAVSARDDFLSIAGHELRNPLAALSAQLLGLEEMQLDETQRARKLGAAKRQVRRLSTLVEELLDVSRIVHGQLRLERERVDLSRVVADVTERLGEEFARAGTPLELQVSGAIFGNWDRLRLDLVVSNLLSNALRYGEGQPVRVRVESEAQLARVIVEDRGIGIKPEDQARIFERFVRAVPARAYGGLGVGLWLAREIVEAHAGRLTVQSSAGEGASFTVELPL